MPSGRGLLSFPVRNRPPQGCRTVWIERRPRIPGAGLSFKAYRFYQNPNVQTYGFLVLLAVFLSGIGGFLFSFAMTLSNSYISGLVALLP